MKKLYVIALLMSFASPLMAKESHSEAFVLTKKQLYACRRARLIDAAASPRLITALVARLLTDTVYQPIHGELLDYSTTLETIEREMANLCSHAETKTYEEMDREFDDIRYRLGDTIRRINSTTGAFNEASYALGATIPSDD